MPSCCVSKCPSKTGAPFRKKVKYFSFPKDFSLMRKWLVACGKNQDYSVKFARVCARHFAKDCFILRKTRGPSPKDVLKLKDGAVPSLFLTPPSKRKEDNGQVVEEKETKLCLEVPSDSNLTNVSENMTLSPECIYIRETDGFVKEIENLQNINKFLQFQINQLLLILEHTKQKLAAMEANKEKDIKENLKLILGHIFTEEQINKLMAVNRNYIRWSSEDVTSAVTLLSIGLPISQGHETNFSSLGKFTS